MVKKYGEVWLQTRQFGVSLENIAEDTIGKALFEYPLDSGQYEMFEVKAIEYIREHHEIWVVNTLNGVTEHTPQELKYDDTLGVPHRVTEDNPLPVTAHSKAVTYVTITAITSGNSVIVIPSSGKKIRVCWFSYCNEHNTMVIIGMRFGTSGGIKHRIGLAPSGVPYNANLIDANWEGAVDEILNAWCNGTYGSGVDFTVGYVEV